MLKCYKPTTINEVLELRKNYDTTIFSGGTDFMVRYKNISGANIKCDKYIIFIGHIEELKQIYIYKDHIKLGSAVTLNFLQEDKRVPCILREAISNMASPAIRNMATLGGNICNASPAGDTLPVLYALEALVVLESLYGVREIPIKEFIIGPGMINIGNDEVLKYIIIPRFTYNSSLYKKVGTRKADAIAKLSFVGLKDMSEDGTIKDIRIAFGAVAPKIVKDKEFESELIGRSNREIKAMNIEIIKKYERHIEPINDQRSTAIYRKRVSLKLLEYFLDN